MFCFRKKGLSYLIPEFVTQKARADKRIFKG